MTCCCNSKRETGRKLAVTLYSDPAFTRFASNRRSVSEPGTGVYLHFIGLDIVCIALHSGLIVYGCAMLVKKVAPLICVRRHTQKFKEHSNPLRSSFLDDLQSAEKAGTEYQVNERVPGQLASDNLNLFVVVISAFFCNDIETRRRKICHM